MKTLHLTLKKKWFDMILSGEKKEEYRKMKPYWNKRLTGHGFDVVHFRNGYSKNARAMTVEILWIEDGLTGEIKWGASGWERYHVIRLGKVLSTENI